MTLFQFINESNRDLKSMIEFIKANIDNGSEKSIRKIFNELSLTKPDNIDEWFKNRGIEDAQDDIIGIFDLDTSTISKNTRDFLSQSEKDGKVINVSFELPKSFILCREKESYRVYISQISSQTLLKRNYSYKRVYENEK